MHMPLFCFGASTAISQGEVLKLGGAIHDAARQVLLSAGHVYRVGAASVAGLRVRRRILVIVR